MKAPITSGLTDSEAVLSPLDLIEHIGRMQGKKPPKLPKLCILAFFREMYPVVQQRYNSRAISYPSEDNPLFDPIHTFEHKGLDIAFVFPGVGAPNAAVTLEMMIAFGAEYFIILGAVGTLTQEIERGEVIVPIRALRDEGTSYHYEEAGRFSYPSELMVKCITQALVEREVPFHEGGTWTTDAIFRETEKEVSDYREEGCLAVEMEAAALFSVARFRKKDIGAIFSAGDCIARKKWDPRKAKDEAGKREEERDALLDYALDAFYVLMNR